MEPKRPCRPINLTHLMYLSAATNRITVTWGNYGKVCAEETTRSCTSERRKALLLISSPPAFSPQSYSVGLYLVRQMTSAELLQRLKTIGIKHPELCKALGEYVSFRGGSGSCATCLSGRSFPNRQAAGDVLGDSCPASRNFFPPVM